MTPDAPPEAVCGHLDVRGRRFAWGERTYVMAVVNVTDDSFSGDGVGSDVSAAVSVGMRALKQGADILDVGGESTRPGAEPVSARQELGRVVPAVRALRSRTDAPISVDTHKSVVAEAALDAGADIVNDVWGLRRDPDLARLVAERRVPVVIMHNRSDARRATQREGIGGHYEGIAYRDVMAEVRSELQAAVEVAVAAGVDRDRIIVDPGLGFGKGAEDNLALIDRLSELRSLGLPILVGPSRKSFIGLTLDAPPGDRVEGTAAAVAVAIARGADIVRVHDVRPMVRVARMTDAIVRSPRTR